MKKTFTILFILGLFCVNAISQNKPDWENPEVFAINKEDTRATSIPYSTEELAKNDVYESSPYYKSLNGNWKFHWVPKVSDVPQGFY